MNGGSHRVDLAAEPDFRLGGLLVCPSACKVTANDEDERIEPRVMEVLVVLWRSAGQTVTRGQLIDACWEGRVVSDDAVSRIIAKVRQVGREADPAHFTVETVPKVGFRLVPQSVAREQHEGGVRDILAKAPNAIAWDRVGRAAWVGPLAAIAIGLVALLGWRGPARYSPEQAIGRIAISSFAAPDANPESARLAQRVPTTLQTILGGSGISVVTSGTPDSDAEFWVSGNVERQGDKDVIVASVIKRGGGQALWSGRYERPIGEPAGLDQEFSAKLASILLCAVEERKAAKAMTDDVLSLLLYACDGDVDIAATRRLVERAPDLAGAHALLAFALASQSESVQHLPRDAALLAAQANASTARALALDPTHALAHAVRGMRLDAPPLSLAERERHLRRALELHPGSMPAGVRYIVLLREVGRLKAALEVAHRTATSPRAISVLVHLAFLEAQLGSLDSAYHTVDRLAALRPQWRGIRLVIVEWWENRTNMRRLRKFVPLARRDEVECFEAHFAAMEAATGAPVKGLSESCSTMSAEWRARLLARHGDIDGAYDLIAKPHPNERAWWFLFYPEMKAFRRDARFMPLADRLGLLRYWRETNQWPDFCFEPDLPYDCRSFGREKRPPQVIGIPTTDRRAD